MHHFTYQLVSEWIVGLLACSSCAAVSHLTSISSFIVYNYIIYSPRLQPYQEKMEAYRTLNVFFSHWRKHFLHRWWWHPLQLALVVFFLPPTGAHTPLALEQLALCGGGMYFKFSMYWTSPTWWQSYTMHHNLLAICSDACPPQSPERSLRAFPRRFQRGQPTRRSGYYHRW